jgi:O-antigen/teichoic acid export membrane protein
MNIKHILQQNIGGKLFNHCIVFFINIFIVRLIGPSLSGYYFNELYIINFFVFLFSLGLDYSAIAWLSKEPDLLSVIFKKLLQTAFLFITLMLLFLFVVPNYVNIEHSQGLWAIQFFASGNILLILFQGILSALKKFNTQNAILILSNLLFLFFLFWIDNHSIKNVFNWVSTGYGILFFLQGIIMTIFSFKKSTDRLIQINWSSFFKHGFFIMVSSIIYFCFLRIDNIYVEKYCDEITLSNYIQCGKVGQYFIYFSSIISSTLLPFITTEKIAHSYSEWKNLIKPYIFLIIIGAIGLAILGNLIYPFLFGKAFDQMNTYMLILLPGYVCLGMLTLLNAIYLGKGNIQKIFKGDLLGFLLVFGLDSILVPNYGVIAASMISSSAYCIVFLFLWLDVKNQF